MVVLWYNGHYTDGAYKSVQCDVDVGGIYDTLSCTEYAIDEWSVGRT
jgi:hypothetical protein